jgi:hypothetical protein
MNKTWCATITALGSLQAFSNNVFGELYAEAEDVGDAKGQM